MSTETTETDTTENQTGPQQELSDINAGQSDKGGVIVGMFVVVGFVAAAVGLWFMQGDKLERQVKQVDAKDRKYERPLISETGPWPKAAIDAKEHYFGSMELGDEGEHSYVVTNNGEVDLVLKQGPKSCACTGYDIDNKRLKPGESTKIHVAWRPKEPKNLFQQNMNLYTNDPENSVVILTVGGTVAALVNIIPKGEWDLGNVDEADGGKASGVLASALTEKVEVASVVVSDEAIKYEFKQAADKDIKALRGADAKELYVSLDKSIPAGPFRGTLTFTLKDHPEREYVINLKAHRDGSVNFQSTGEVFYDKRRSLVDLGSFSAAEGKTGSIMLYLSGEHQEMAVSDVACVPQFMNCSLTRDPGFRSTKKTRYILKFDVPAGSPPGGFTADKSGKVTLKTNHPEYPTINLVVRFVSTKEVATK